MKVAKYKAKPNTSFTDRDAEIIGKFLDKTFPKGNFTPEQIVDLAGDRKSPIHQYFEWDDTKAARLYRIQRARKLIQCLVVQIQGNSSPAFVNVKLAEEDRGKYFQTESCLETPEIWQLVLEKALSELTSWRARYANFKQLKPLYKVIDQTIKPKQKGK
jgi:hypothetical protein